MSWRAFNVLPSLAERYDITYVTTGDEIPPAAFKEVRRFPKWKHMMLAGFSLSKCVDQLFAAGSIDLAVVYASVGFAIRKTPYVALEGGSVYQEIRLFSPLTPWYRRSRFLIGLLHHALPEMVSIRRARHVIAVSHALKRNLMVLHGLSEDGVSVVNNGVGREYLNVYSTRTPWPPLRALYVGRLHFGKGILRTLEEFTRRSEIDMEFVLAGDGPDRAAIERLARDDRRIVCLGEIPRHRLIDLLSTSHIFVFPSHHEGFSSSLAEAMAAGLTCLTYDIPITREMLGDAGIMVPLGNAGAMIDRLAGLVKDPSPIRQYGKAAHDRASQFSWDKCAGQIGMVLEEQLQGTFAGDRDA